MQKKSEFFRGQGETFRLLVSTESKNHYATETQETTNVWHILVKTQNTQVIDGQLLEKHFQMEFTPSINNLSGED